MMTMTRMMLLREDDSIEGGDEDDNGYGEGDSYVQNGADGEDDAVHDVEEDEAAHDGVGHAEFKKYDDDDAVDDDVLLTMLRLWLIMPLVMPRFYDILADGALTFALVFF